jgi:hypothetical protein
MCFGLVFKDWILQTAIAGYSCVVFHWLGTWLPAWERQTASRLVAAQFSSKPLEISAGHQKGKAYFSG